MNRPLWTTSDSTATRLCSTGRTILSRFRMLPLWICRLAGTIEAWVKLDTLGRWHGVIAKGNANNNAAHNYALEITNDNAILCVLGSGHRTAQSLAGTNPSRGGTVHASGVHMERNDLFALYQWRAEQLIGQPVTPEANASPLYIGQFGGASDRLDGTIDEVRIYNRALTSVEIQTDMNLPVSVTSPGDTTPPTITGVAASAPTTTGTTITWTTNEESDSQVEYGLDTTYGSQTTLDTTGVTSHSQMLSGLSAASAYNYRVKSRDASGNLSVSPNFTFTTTAAPPPGGGGGGGGGGTGDATPPSVSISALSAGTVSGTIVVTANASDDNAVRGVQFRLDGVNLGAEDTTAPYSVNWDTLTASNGTHTLTALAYDAARNQATSAPVQVVVRNSTMTYSTPEGGGDVWTVAGTAQTVGSARIEPDGGTSAPAGMAIVGHRAGGVLINEASFPASVPVMSGRIAVQINGTVNTGVAIANGGDSDATIQFYFTDAVRQEFGHGSFVLKANRQMSGFLNHPPFFGQSFMEGSFTFVSSGAPVSMLAVRGLTNERGEFLFTTLPVSPIQTGSTAATISGLTMTADADLPSNALLVPHFADGGGWTTHVILTNPTSESLTGTLQFFGQGTAVEPAAPLQLR